MVGGGGGGWVSGGEQIVFLPEPGPLDPDRRYLKPQPDRISEILI